MAAKVRTENGRVWLEGVDRYRVMGALFECVRVVLASRNEPYSPAYVQGLSCAAFRIGGICPCVPTVACTMGTDGLIQLMGYEYEHLSLHEEGIDVETEAEKSMCVAPHVIQ